MGEKLTGLEYLQSKVAMLQNLRDCALAISDQMKLSPGGDQFTYEGGMEAVELFREFEARIVAFEHQHGRTALRKESQ